jgi:SAM-dependent methyltransferase
MTPTPRTPAPSVPDVRQPGAPVPLAVWPVGQTPKADQWTARYLPGSADQPPSITPELARWIIVEYSQPGELILDPRCRAGSTLVEAAVRDRRAIGVETHDSWARLAVANCEHNLAPDTWPLIEVITGDPRRLADLIGDHDGQIDLVILCPHEGINTDSSPSTGQQRLTLTLGRGPGTPTGTAVAPEPQLEHWDVSSDAVGVLVGACGQVLRPGGLLVTVTGNTHGPDRLIDRASDTVAAAQAAGLDYLQHIVAVHAAVRDSALVAPLTASTGEAGDASEYATRSHRVAHHDVLVFRNPAGAAAAADRVSSGSTP